MNTLSNQSIHQGIVYRKSTGFYTVFNGEQMIPCRIAVHLKKQSVPANDERRTGRNGNRRRRSYSAKEVLTDELAVETLTVGDRVEFTYTQEGGGTVVAVLPRRSRFSRRAALPGNHPVEQVIAANVDLVVPVFAAAEPPPRWNMLDRYLVSAESLELPVLVCITKLDLLTTGSELDEEIREAVEDYRRIGYRVELVSARTGEGMEALKQALQGRISVLVGKSGVGKTTLLNALQPGLGLRVSEVSQATGKGKHTTTHPEMFPLDMGGAIVDTPGVREFGLWDVNADDLTLFFPEMRPFAGRCRFGLDCRHDEEPGCAIRQAVVQGRISPRRYYSYLRLRAEA